MPLIKIRQDFGDGKNYGQIKRYIFKQIKLLINYRGGILTNRYSITTFAYFV